MGESKEDAGGRLALAEHVRSELIRLLELVEQAEKNGRTPGLMPTGPVAMHLVAATRYLSPLIASLKAEDRAGRGDRDGRE